MPLVAYGASFVLDGAKGPRTVPASEFFVLPEKDPTRENVLEPGEVLLEIRVPPMNGWRSAYYEVRERADFDWPLVDVVVALKVEGGVVRDARVVLGQVAIAPLEIPFVVSGLAFVKGYGVLYSDRAIALLPRLGIAPPPQGVSG